MIRIGVATDHGGYKLKSVLVIFLKNAGYEVFDFGAQILSEEDDYPDYVIPLAKAVASGEVFRGVAICGSGVGACIVANKIVGARAALINDSFSAHQGVEDDDMNILCLGGGVTGPDLACELVELFVKANFKGDERFKRRLNKVALIENQRDPT